MKKRMYRTRRRMNHVVSELSHALLLAGGREIDLHLSREEEGLRLRVEGDFSPEHQSGEDQYTDESEMALVGQMVDESKIVVEPGRVRMNLFLAF